MLLPLPGQAPPEEEFTYYESDLFLLRRAFLPEAREVFVLDPHQKVVRNRDTELSFIRTRRELDRIGKRPVPYALINLSRLPICAHPISRERLTAALTFFPSPRDEGLLPHAFTHYVMANPYGGMRWIIPGHLRHARFLRMYAEDVYHPLVYRWIVGAAAAMGRWRWVTDIRFRLYRKDDRPLPFLQERDGGFDAFALFGGRLNLHGRALVALYTGKRVEAFVKMAVRGGAVASLRREYDALRKLATYAFERLVIPSATWHESYIALTPIFSDAVPPLEHLDAPFLAAWRAVQRPFDRIADVPQWLEEARWREVWDELYSRARQRDVPVGVSARNVMRLLEAMKEAMTRLEGARLRFSLVHGDFSGRNIRWDGRKIYAVDWERMRWKAPAMSDFLAFWLAPFEARGTTDPEEVWPAVEKWMQDPRVQKALDMEASAIRRHFLMGLLDRSLYYLDRILSQDSIYHHINLRFYLWYRLFQTFYR